MKSILRMKQGARLAPLSSAREGRPVGICCDNCGLDRVAVEQTADALGISAALLPPGGCEYPGTLDVICCEVEDIRHCAHGERLGAFCASCESERVG